MAYTPKKYRRLVDSHIFTAVQHTMSPDFQVSNVINQLGAFILGTDVERSVGIQNERMLDVIRPVENEWNPRAGVATVEVIDPNSGLRSHVRLGDWIVKHTDSKGDFLLFVKPDVFRLGYAEVPVFEELTALVHSVLSNSKQDGQQIAEDVASAVLAAGWSKKG